MSYDSIEVYESIYQIMMEVLKEDTNGPLFCPQVYDREASAPVRGCSDVWGVGDQGKHVPGMYHTTQI